MIWINQFEYSLGFQVFTFLFIFISSITFLSFLINEAIGLPLKRIGDNGSVVSMFDMKRIGLRFTSGFLEGFARKHNHN